MIISTSDQSSAELEDFAHLDDKSLRQRWRRLAGCSMPDGLGRALAVRVLAYQQQARLLGDLDAASRRALADVLKRSMASKSTGALAQTSELPAVVSKIDQTVTLLRPGTMLKREHGGVLHRVMVMEQGFGWNGENYDSLSKVAFAITGTRWNGPRFFGLRDKGNGPGRSRASRAAKSDASKNSRVDKMTGAWGQEALP